MLTTPVFITLTLLSGAYGLNYLADPVATLESLPERTVTLNEMPAFVHGLGFELSAGDMECMRLSKRGQVERMELYLNRLDGGVLKILVLHVGHGDEDARVVDGVIATASVSWKAPTEQKTVHDGKDCSVHFRGFKTRYHCKDLYKTITVPRCLTSSESQEVFDKLKVAARNELKNYIE